MKTYDKYKPSKVEWIGDIPEHWNIIRLKYIGNSIIGVVYNLQEITQNKDDGILVLRSSNIQNGLLSLNDTVYIDKTISQNLILKQGDILICSRNGSRALIGKNITIEEDMVGSTFGAFMTVFRTNNFKFMSKYFNSQVFSGQSDLFLTSTINQLTINTINNFLVALPPKDEQEEIANFLDKKTNEIDEMLVDKEGLIKLLKNEKEITISNAVTKGLSPDVKMQNSGFEYIGEIPLNWDSIAIKHIVSVPVTDGPHETPEFLNSGIPFISAEAIKNNIIDFSKMRGYISRENHLKYSKKYKPQRDDIYMIKSGATTGNLAMVETDKEFNIWSPLAVIRVNKSKLLPKFTFYFLLSYNFFEAVKFNWSYGTQQNIGMNVIENISICVPLDLNEQQNIVDFLDKKTDEINQTIQTVKDEIKFLKEYKETLIYEVVTGKVDVREEVVS